MSDLAKIWDSVARAQLEIAEAINHERVRRAAAASSKVNSDTAQPRELLNKVSSEDYVRSSRPRLRWLPARASE